MKHKVKWKRIWHTKTNQIGNSIGIFRCNERIISWFFNMFQTIPSSFYWIREFLRKFCWLVSKNQWKLLFYDYMCFFLANISYLILWYRKPQLWLCINSNVSSSFFFIPVYSSFSKKLIKFKLIASFINLKRIEILHGH